MQQQEFTLKNNDGHDIFVRLWMPEKGVSQARNVIHINHGMAEHSARYAPIAERLTRAGAIVYAHDTRGHGRSVQGHDLLGHYADQDGWNKVISDVKCVNEHIREQHPTLPLVIFGHSMGSFVVRCFMKRNPDAATAMILSGTASHSLVDIIKARAGITLETFRHGPKGRSELLDALSFATYNKVFAPNRTVADWLSRDPREVDKYVNDPLCGYLCTNQFWSDLIGGIEEIRLPSAIRPLKKTMPVLMFSGERDPLSFHPTEHGIRKLANMYETAGMQNVAVKLFPNGRHEILNETNRQEVIDFLIEWMELQQLFLPAPTSKKRSSKKTAAHG